MVQTILELKGISLNFGGIQALIDVDLNVKDGEILSIIGPNGAGKTCLLNCINGFYKPSKGTIIFEGHELTRLHPHKIARIGIARTFQNIALYSGMSTVDNLMAGRHSFIRQNFVTGALYFGPGRGEEMKHRRVVEEIIDFLEITPVRKKIVGTLPYGLRKEVLEEPSP